MYIELVTSLRGSKLDKWKRLMSATGLAESSPAEYTALMWDGDDLAATGARDGSILKYLAVHPEHQGEDLLSAIITELRRDAFEKGYRHLFIYTKPSNKFVFSSLFFYPIIETDNVLFMENKKGGISDFINMLPEGDPNGITGALVMNCNPFTLGHRYLVEKASCECDRVYVFVLSEEGSGFSSRDRLEMVKLGTKDLENVTVLETGPYLISSATFPTYFLKDRDLADKVACDMDIEIFTEYFVPRLCIKRRYVGTEPHSPMTEKYNEALKGALPKRGIELHEIERKISDGDAISASRVRALIKSGETKSLSSLLPQTTIDYLKNNKLI